MTQKQQRKVKQTHVKKCMSCGKTFHAGKDSAKTCSTKCRTKLHRDNKSGNGKTWVAVPGVWAERAQQLKELSPASYSCIELILTNYGAIVACDAINAAWMAFVAGVNEAERVMSEKGSRKQ